MAVATYTDVGVALRRTISDAAEQAQITWWLNGVELFITARLGDVAELDQDVVKYVEVEAVVAKINRAGRTESRITVAVDDGSVSRYYENAITSSDITEEWWNLLDPTFGSGMHSVRPSFDEDDAQWAVSSPHAPGYFADEPGWR